MSLDHLTLDIQHHINSGKFKVGGDFNHRGREEIVETFLLGQIGAGKDKRKANKRDTYHIRLEWYPEDDRIVASCNTGNKGLRDGILIHYLQDLDK